MWELCDGKRTVSDMVSAICQEYDSPVDTIEEDVLEILRDLADEKLVEENI